MNLPAIIGRNLCKIYGARGNETAALRGLDVDAWAGEVMLLVGPSGSGKTTLLSIMGGILRPTSGLLRIANEEATQLDEKELARLRRRHIGFVFQGYNLFPTLRAWQNVAVALDLKGVPRRKLRKTAAELLESVGLAEKRNAFPADLSGGQKQRVAIARALAGDPGIILADEPTAALDWENGRTVMALLRSLASEHGRAVVIVTHDNRIIEYADRILRIEDGRIVERSDRRGSLLYVASDNDRTRLPASAVSERSASSVSMR